MTLELARTPLFNLQQQAGARMVPFAGYEMAVQFTGIIEEHTHTRTAASLFDVSHMGQTTLSGPLDLILNFLEKITPADVRTLQPGQMRYSVLLNEKGGIVDDLMINRRQHDWLLIVNAARKLIDYSVFRQHLPAELTLSPLDSYALLALQGPEASRIAAVLWPEMNDLTFMTGAVVRFNNMHVYATRSGYTGEDGYEFSMPAPLANSVAKALLEQRNTRWAGLGARDTLRLEAGLCLYGHDLNEGITPVQADLNWVIGKNRRDNPSFLGAGTIMAELTNKPAIKRAAWIVEGKAPVREEALIKTTAGEQVGIVTSGGFSPTLGKPIIMGYVQTAHLNSALLAEQRGRSQPLTRVKLPFVPHRYYKG